MIKQEDFLHSQENKLMPGHMLKSARETQGIPIETASKHLHLTATTLSAIESDYYEKMPAPVYVRGYIKKYAQFLKINSEEVLQAFEQNVEIKSKTLEVMPSFVKKKPISSKHMGIRFLTLMIGIIILVLVGLWLHTHEKSEKTSSHTAPTSKSVKPKETSSSVTQPTLIQEAKPIDVSPLELKTESAPEKSIPEEKTQPLLNSPSEKSTEPEKQFKKKKSPKPSHHLYPTTNGSELYY